MAHYEKEILKLVKILLHKLFIYDSENFAIQGNKLDIGQLELLSIIALEEGRSMGECQQQFGHSRNIFSSCTKNLLAKGLIVKKPSPKDKRIINFYLTDLGRKVYENADFFEKELLSNILKEFTVNEEKAILKFLSKVNQSTVDKMEIENEKGK